MTAGKGIELKWPGRRGEIDLSARPVIRRTVRRFPGSDHRAESESHNLLLQGDNGDGMRYLLTTLRRKVQLIYLDPPFATGRKFRQPQGMQSRQASHQLAYDDNWAHGEGVYLNLLEERLQLARELLCDSGALYLHLDYRIAPAARLLLDEIFDPGCFVNEIIWYYRTGGMPVKLGFGRKHDTILFYVKDPTSAVWHPQQEKSYLSHRYGFSNIRLHEDEQGIYTLANMRDVWDIPALRGNQPEKVPYPTQKPLQLLERIIRASSNPGDIVLDPFAGSGTTLVAAEQLERRWIGMDSSPLAIGVIQNRLAALPERQGYEIHSPAALEWEQGDGQKGHGARGGYRELILNNYQEPVSIASGSIYHAHLKQEAVYVLEPQEQLTPSGCQKLMEGCRSDGFRQLTLLVSDVDRAKATGWWRSADRLNLTLTLKQVPRELLNGAVAKRQQLSFDEMPRVIWQRRQSHRGSVMELRELRFSAPSERQREVLQENGWRGLISSWWAVDRSGLVCWESGTLKGNIGAEPLLSGPLPKGVRLHPEIRSRSGQVW